MILKKNFLPIDKLSNFFNLKDIYMFNFFRKRFNAAQANILATRPPIVLPKLKKAIYELIKTTASLGFTEVDFKFSKEATINQIRQIQLSLHYDGYKLQTIFNYPHKDEIKSIDGVLNLSSLNDYLDFESAKITIFW
jgi:hypothetical protein